MNTLPEPLNPKKDLGRFSASCFTYSIVMLVVVILYTIFSYFFVLFQEGFDIGKTEEFVKNFMEKDGGSYIIASCLGVLIFTIFRGKQLFTRDLRKKNKKMTAKVFFFMICFLFLSQLFSTLTSQIMNAILSLFGLDLSEILSQDFSSHSITMFIYTTIMAPITEEIIFRGAGLRALEKHGKVFAIIMTALLFGLFHENLYQVYFAALIGLGFGYIAFEYSIFWAIFFHIFNNLVIAEGLDFLTNYIPESIVNLINYGLMTAGTTVVLIVLILNRSKIKAYIAENRSQPGTYKQALKSVWFWVFSILCVLAAFLPILLVYITTR